MNAPISVCNNPVFEELQFGFGSNQEQAVRYQIYNINDQMIAKGKVDAQRGYNTKTIPVTFSQKGHYFLLLFNDEVREAVKFTKLD